MAQRAGRALREKWAFEARAAERARDPKLAAQDAAERAAMDFRARTRQRYGQLLRAAVTSGELSVEDALARLDAAEERTYELLRRKRLSIFGEAF